MLFPNLRFHLSRAIRRFPDEGDPCRGGAGTGHQAWEGIYETVSGREDLSYLNAPEEASVSKRCSKESPGF